MNIFEDVEMTVIKLLGLNEPEKKDIRETFYTYPLPSGSYSPDLEQEVNIPIRYNGASGSTYYAPEPLDVSDDWIDRIWQKMYEKPVIVRCSHCNSHNVITNPTCIQCGAPMGDYKRMKVYG